MLPSEALQFEFSKQTRVRGASYVQPGLIRLTLGTPDEVTALVQGRNPYDVCIRRMGTTDATEFIASCTCQYFRDNREACKHVWAVLRFAEREGHLRGDGRPLARHSTFLALSREGDPVPKPSARGRAFTRPVSRPQSPASAFLANLTHHVAARETATARPARYADSLFLYVLDTFQSTHLTHVVVSVMHQPRTTQGAGIRPKAVQLTPADVAHAPPSDRRLLALLTGAPFRDIHATFEPPAERTATFSVPSPLAAELLPAMARTARMWLRSGPDPLALEPLTWDDGNAWRFEVDVAEHAGPNYLVTGRLTRDDMVVPITERVCPLAGGLVIVRRTLARLEQGASLPFLAELCRTGPIAIGPDEAPTLAEVVARSGIVVPTLPDALRIVEVRPVPRPRLSIGPRGHRHADWLDAWLSFDYDGLVMEPGADSARFDPVTRRFIRRNEQAEASAEARLSYLGVAPVRHGEDGEFELPAHRLTETVRELVNDHWHIEAQGVRYVAPRSVNLTVSSGIDWFDLQATVSFGDTSIPLADVLAALKPGESSVRLGDGNIGILPEQWLARYQGLVAAGEVTGDTIRFRRAQAAILDALLAMRASDTAIRVDEVFEHARAELAAFASVGPIDPEASFTGELRGYQREGLGWFAFLRQFGFGGCLADDMGLGKTIMVLALLDARRQHASPADAPNPPSLVVVPRSLVGNWLAEASRFTPGLRILDHSHGARSAEATSFANVDVVLVTFGTLRRDIEALSTVEFDYVILDEAQAIKNAATAAAKATRLVRARHRLALSGTPIENHLGELWSLFEFLNPGILGRSSMFKRMTSPERADAATTTLLSRGLRPFILRRTKRQVARELPEKTEHTIMCELLPKDRRLYDALRNHYRRTLLDRIDSQGLGKSRMHVLEGLLRLRQASCHAGLIDPARAADDSAKFDVLIPQLQEVVEEGHKAIVFSQFTTLLSLLRQRLDAAKLPYEYLDGKTRDRTARVQRFQEDPAVPLFLISLKAGGLGLNLTAAEYVFLLDPWWNPAAEAQAIDRAHRIGQVNEVFVYRLIAKDTVEEKVLALQQSKRELADAVLTADAVGLRDLSRDDLELLLS